MCLDISYSIIVAQGAALVKERVPWYSEKSFFIFLLSRQHFPPLIRYTGVNAAREERDNMVEELYVRP